MIGVIDYGAGNLGSVMNALARLSVPARFIEGPEQFSAYEKIIFPGDGHFATAMASLERSGYAQAIQEWLAADKPFLGICIGLQLLFDSSEEAPPIDGKLVRGLGVIPGTVRRFPGSKVPQIGWNSTEARADSSLFKDLPVGSFFYYIHSYYADPLDNAVTAATADYYLRYCASIERGALAATQFHPEKSGTVGLKLLENFLTSNWYWASE